MKFYYNGRKEPSEAYNVASGCLLIIGLSALIFAFSLIEDLDDIKENWLQLLFGVIMAFSILFGMFKKKGKLHAYSIEIKNGYLNMNSIATYLENIQFDIYTKDGKFERYHLWDTKGKIAIYSAFEDDLSNYFLKEQSSQTTTKEIAEFRSRDFEYTISTAHESLSYDLDSGHYSIVKDHKEITSVTPESFAYDGKYKLGIGLTKKK